MNSHIGRPVDYHHVNSCETCKWCRIVNPLDEGPEFFCQVDGTVPPPSEDEPDVEIGSELWKARWMARIKYEEPRGVAAIGICSQFEISDKAGSEYQSR
jgi:hypothetical protein